MARIALGGRARDYDSDKSRESLQNLIFEINRDGSFSDIRRTEGLTLLNDTLTDPVRSNMRVIGSKMYFVSGTSFFSVDTNWAVVNLGAVGGSGRARIVSNAKNTGAQILVLNGTGDGYIYTVAGGLAQITDPDYLSSTSADILNERFWLVRDNTNEFFASEISDGTSYNALSVAVAEESPDDVVGIVAKKSSLWVIGTEKTEFWQSFDDPTLPVRRVKYSTKERGMLAPDSLAEVGEFFAFLADDGTVRLIQDTNFQRISDLELELRIKGNGTAQYPGFTHPERAFGFFSDGPVNKVYYLTFPDDNYTWGYDITTGLTHTRDSDDTGTWRVGAVTRFNNMLVGGDWKDGNLWELDAAAFDEGGKKIRTRIITPPVETQVDMTIPTIHIEMELGQVTDGSDPQMMVYFTKDGGNTWTNKGQVSLGKAGEFGKRLVLRQFGRVVKYKEFALQLEITDAVPTRFYSAWIP